MKFGTSVGVFSQPCLLGKQQYEKVELKVWCPCMNCVFFRMNFISTSSSIHLAKMEFLENKHHMQAFLSLAESKLKSWIIKYGQQESVELMLHSYIVSSVSSSPAF